jgi:hypothetical protein
MAALKTILRRAKTLLWTAFSILVVLAAVMGGQAADAYGDHCQPRQAWLSQNSGVRCWTASAAVDGVQVRLLPGISSWPKRSVPRWRRSSPGAISQRRSTSIR